MEEKITFAQARKIFEDTFNIKIPANLSYPDAAQIAYNFLGTDPFEEKLEYIRRNFPELDTSHKAPSRFFRMINIIREFAETQADRRYLECMYGEWKDFAEVVKDLEDVDADILLKWLIKVRRGR